MADPDDRAFGQGIAIGVAFAAIAIHLALWNFGGGMKDAYRDFEATLPLFTRLTLSSGWHAGVPLVGGAASALLIVRRPTSLAPYLVLAIVLVVAAAMSWWFPMAPMYELAGNIK